MTRTIALIAMFFGACAVGLALDPTIKTATAIALVRDALTSLGEYDTPAKIKIEPWPNYYAPDFITLQAWRPNPESVTMDTWYFAVNPWTGDVWEPFGCIRITSPTIKRKQDEIWKSSKLPDEARHVLEARAPACTPAKLELSPGRK